MGMKTKRKIARYSLETVLIIFLIVGMLAALYGFFMSFGCVRGTIYYDMTVAKYGKDVVDYEENMVAYHLVGGNILMAGNLALLCYFFPDKKKGGKNA